jgi:hypothetical protein
MHGRQVSLTLYQFGAVCGDLANSSYIFYPTVLAAAEGALSGDAGPWGAEICRYAEQVVKRSKKQRPLVQLKQWLEGIGC